MDDVAYLKRLMRRKGTPAAHRRLGPPTIAAHLVAITLLVAGGLVLLAVPSVTLIVAGLSVMLSGG